MLESQMKLPICGEQIMRWYLLAGAEQRSRTAASIRGESPSHPGGAVGLAGVRPWIPPGLTSPSNRRSKGRV